MGGGYFLFALFKSIISYGWGEWILCWSKLLILFIKGIETKFHVSSLRSCEERSSISLNRFLDIFKSDSWLQVLLFKKRDLIVLKDFGFLKGCINIESLDLVK